MTGDIDILHHIGLITANMDGLIARYEQLGFTFTPLSLPRIRLRADAEPEVLGAGNRCAIFRNNYLEVLAVVDRARWDKVTTAQRGSFDIDPPLARYEGLHVMHFGADDIELVRQRFLRDATPCAEIGLFQRNVDTATGPQMMQAKYISLPKGGGLPSLTQIAQHVTPDLVLQPRYQHHRNGATSITECIVCAAAPEAVAARYARVAGHPVQRQGSLFVLDLGHSRVIVVAPEHLGELVPGAVPPTLPFLAGFTVATESLEKAREILVGAAVPFAERDGRLIVGAASAFGSAVLFESEGRTR